MRKRAIILSTAITFGFIAVVFRLVDIMLFNHEWFSAKAKFQQVRKEIIPVKRGIIFDRRGRELAINLDTESIYADPSEITSPDKVASALSERINQKPEIILAKLNTDRRFNWIKRKVGIEYAQGIKDLKLRGIGFAPEVKRYYPKGSLASHVIGFVNVDNSGLEGVERRYDRYLAPRSEKAYVFRDAKGNVLSDGQGFSLSREIKGNNLVLTIDEGLQYILEKNLDAAYLHWKAASATAIMMDPYTGEILAMANRPTFDINDPSDAAPNQRRNRAITDCYEPGSTFKIIAGTAALEEGIVNPDTKFDCSAGYIEVGGKRIKDDHRHGVLSFKEVIQKSSNVGTIKIGFSLGRERLYEYIKRFGFGEKTGIDLVGEVSGWVHSPSKWSGTSIGAISIGQEIAVTPLQVLRAYAAIANGGFLVRPYVVSEVKSPDGNTVYKINPEAKRILSEKTVNVFREILKTVTEEGGTAPEAAVDGNQVAGKTGTAQLIDPKTRRYSKEKFVSSFVGFVPADKPKIAMIVVIHEPKGQIYGGVVAGPVFRKIASESLSYLSVPRDDSGEKGLLMVSKK
ncbi:peptidoglycan D,D-transpeptidase FtsI family protein [Dissulfurispira sp.]|uniref:peptidoglycan D,D-transpeptidase FtsI family protein n=1 Tax=Dissulfurispira sp. TaxID=2817609 RepID=UPI002FDA5232